MEWFRQLVRSYRNATFRLQLAILAAACVASLSFFAALATAWHSSHQIRASQLLQGQRIAQSLASQGRMALIFNSPESAEEGVAATLSFPDVTRVELRYADGRLLMARGRPLSDAPAAAIATDQEAYLESEDELGWRFVALVLTQPGGDAPFDMTERQDKVLGFVRVSQNKATLTHLVREVFLVNFTTALLFASIFLLAVRILVDRLTRPLRDLSKTMARAGAGETGLRADLAGPRDLAEMAHAFNSMMNALEDREAELRTARDGALQFAKLKADFAATVSHEIRTPLNGVIGTLDMLKTGYMKPDQRQLLELAWDSSQYLLELANNILDFSRLEAGRMEAEMSDFDLNPLIDRTMNVFFAQAAAKRLELSANVAPAIPPRLVGDPARIRQILTNLIGNAIKFTEEGCVSLSAELEPTGYIRFTVTDTGIGIALEDQESIFDSFTQADHTTTRRFGGSGLGLAICKQLVHMLGGRIGVDSTPGQGSRFWFTVPCMPAAPALACAASPTPGTAGGKGHVLIVEDNRINRMVAAGMLQHLGCTSGMADNGTEAIAAWQDGIWDLILMDCNMPETDGYQATAAIRHQESNSGHRIPIIAMTANILPVDIEKCLAAGMDDHLAKPLTLDALAAKLQRWLHWPGATAPTDSAAEEPVHLERLPQ